MPDFCVCPDGACSMAPSLGGLASADREASQAVHARGAGDALDAAKKHGVPIGRACSLDRLHVKFLKASGQDRTTPTVASCERAALQG